MTDTATIRVHFARSGIDADWRKGSLFSLARSLGIRARYGCRTGGCGECAVAIVAGKVRYPRLPAAPCADGHAILCLARPDPDTDDALILDL